MRTFIRPIEDWIALAMVTLAVTLIASVVSCKPAQAMEEYESIVTETVMMEASNQSYEGQLAVSEVIRNRAIRRSGVATWATMYKEVMRPKQFSCWNDKIWAVEWLNGHGNGESYQRASRALNEAINGSNSVHGATLYHTVKVSPSWSKAASVKFVKQIGSHRFYTEGK